MFQGREFFELSDVERRKLVDQNDPASPFYNYVGNHDGVNTLADILYVTLKDKLHRNQGVGVAFYGQASTGKTTLASMYAEVLGLPFLSTNASEIVNIDMFFDMLYNLFSEEGMPLKQIGTRGGKAEYLIYPAVVFLDEIHCLPTASKNALLSACEQGTSRLITKKTDSNCKNIHWLVATTDRGLLPKPLDSRFVKILLHPYTDEEITKILEKHSKLPTEVCKLISCYAKIARVAIDFAKEVKFASERQNLSYEHAVRVVAKRRGINEDGLERKHIDILLSLYADKDSGKPLSQLCEVAGVGKEELSKFLMPVLLLDTPKRRAYVKVSNRHKITEAGILYLKSKNLI